jgi:hypothetical protein
MVTKQSKQSATERVFGAYVKKAWPFVFNATIRARNIAGGVPSDPKVAQGWIASKVTIDDDDLIRAAVAEAMVERGMTKAEAVEEVTNNKSLNGFKRDPKTGLYIEGRQLKAALKEAANVAVGSGKLKQRGWGETKKWMLGFIAEHVIVDNDRLPLLDLDGEFIAEPTGVNQRFVHSRHGSAIQYEEFVEECLIKARILSDYEFKEEEWAMIWLTGEQEGIGSSRSQGFGRYEIVGWERNEDD